MVTYSCPSNTATWSSRAPAWRPWSLGGPWEALEGRQVQEVACVWHRQTDAMLWWPPQIQPCNSESILWHSYIQHFILTSTFYSQDCPKDVMKVGRIDYMGHYSLLVEYHKLSHSKALDVSIDYLLDSRSILMNQSFCNSLFSPIINKSCSWEEIQRT